MQMLCSSIELFQESEYGDPAAVLNLGDDDDDEVNEFDEDPYYQCAETNVSDSESPTDSDEETELT